jgi:hypothetical protein
VRPEIMLGPQVVQKVVGYPQVVLQVVPWTPQDFFQVAHMLRTGCAQVARTGCAQVAHRLRTTCHVCLVFKLFKPKFI